MLRRKCPRTLDKPLLIFGLEIEDIGILGLVGGMGSIVFGPLIPGVLTMGGWAVLIWFKKDKPQGYLLHWLYIHGVDLPGLIPPINKITKYNAHGTFTESKKFKFR